MLLLRVSVSLGLLGLGFPLLLAVQPESPPTDNPAGKYRQKWTEEIAWAQVVDITTVPGTSFDERLKAAQDKLPAAGGVIYFPAGTYLFADHIALRSGVVLRGATPTGKAGVPGPDHRPPTQFVFPRFVPKLEGEGTPITSAFKGIHAQQSETSNIGVVNIAIDRGHIEFTDEGQAPFRAGKNRLVVGCILRNAAVADPAIPDAKIGQHPWQRFTRRHHAAIGLKGENLLVAGNSLPPSGEENFVMKGFVALEKGKKIDLPEVLFDYDNRPGLYVNDYGIGGAGGAGPDGTPQTHPWGFRTGIVIRDNYLYHTGRCAIAFCGDGVLCSGNLIRFKKDVHRPTATGRDVTFGSSTNDNRAVQMRGWRWVVENNDYEVYKNWANDRKYHINDGEGLMHEDHVNSTVKDSKLLNNKGNTYLSIFKTAGIDGLEVRGNDIIDGIFVDADRNKSRHEIKNVSIVSNTVHGGYIRLAGDPASNNRVEGNQSQGKPGKMVIKAAGTVLKDNVNFVDADRE